RFADGGRARGGGAAAEYPDGEDDRGAGAGNAAGVGRRRDDVPDFVAVARKIGRRDGDGVSGGGAVRRYGDAAVPPDGAAGGAIDGDGRAAGGGAARRGGAALQ